ncbi:MAG: carboxypeptidase-like regulatory domain-containing protein [Ignavibacteriales bacterium]|nr:carboxypeptidase-like regulatory domain-containing protein [Ignavibacteriales bacterium]MCF8307299.1 carboxypeptidase-like regulatory domain-containing protein [Ignavibacteriales bacterium]MCF8317041.1 carboxypeptidase-like regulatory domain-containing protein [Ignavibacteriales bacterium]MCF8438648.1 carboxypeptidase-like regulatory domain-containing protein [Ignavibacteriales bacterium]
MRKGFTIFAAVLLMYGCKHDSSIVDADNNGYIFGYVRDSVTLEYLPETIVILGNKQVVTDSTGHYSIPNVSPDNYELSARKSGYTQGTSRVSVVQGDTSFANFFLKREIGKATIFGYIRETSDLAPIPSATITIDTLSIITDLGGYFAISGVEPGDYSISATKSGYDTVSAAITATADDTLIVRLYLTNKVVVPPDTNEVLYWEFKNTGTNHIFSIPTGINPNIKGDPLSPGDLIGAFYDSSGVPACAGFAVWNGSTSVPVAVWGNDNTTTVKEGFNTAETIVWKIRRNSDGKNFTAIATYSLGNGKFEPNGLSILSSLSVP